MPDAACRCRLPAPPGQRCAAAGRAAGRADRLRGLRQVDLRVARVVAAEDVPGAKKLLHLTLSLGGGERRTSSPASRPSIVPSNWWAGC